MNRRQFIKTAAGIGAAAITGRGISYGASASEILRIGYLPITDATPLLIAYAKGFFKDEGVKAEKPLRVRSWSTLSESFLTNKFNLTHLLLPIPVWMRYNIKAPVKILAWDHTNGSAITVRSGEGIKGFADLGGRNIAVPYWYSMHNIILQMGLRKAGLTPVIQNQSKPLKPNQVNLFILPPPEMPLALSGRKIDGFIVAEPYNAIGEVKVRAKIMRFTGDIWKNHPCCVIVMQEKLIQARPVFTQKVVNALVRAQLWILENPEKTAHLLSREGESYLPVPEKILRRVFLNYAMEEYGKNDPRAIRHPEWGISRIGFQPYPYPSATRLIVREMTRTTMEGNTAFLQRLDVDAVAKDLVDDRFVKKAILACGGAGKFTQMNLEHPWDREETISL